MLCRSHTLPINLVKNRCRTIPIPIDARQLHQFHAVGILDCMWQAVLIVFLVSSAAFGRGHFRVQSTVGKVQISVNGKVYPIDSNFTRIRTAYPEFDTLRIVEKSQMGSNPIVCNFKPDSSYSLIVACCSSLDIVPSRKANSDSLRIWLEEYEENVGRIQSLLLDHPQFTLRLKNGSFQDSIYGWYVDYACFPRFRMLDQSGWDYGAADKCFYWTNISTFAFFKSTEDYANDTDSLGVVHDVFPEDGVAVLDRITVRLFDDERFVLDYDVRKGKVVLRREWLRSGKPRLN